MLQLLLVASVRAQTPDFTLKTGQALSVSAASYRRGALAAEAIVTAFGLNLAAGVMAASSLPLPTTLAGTNVKVRDGAGVERSAPLFFVSPTQVNYQMPAGTAPGQAIITITNANGAISADAVEIAPVAPGLFSADARGQGVAGAVVLRIEPDGNQSFEPVSRFDAAQNKVIAAPIDFGPGEDCLFLLLFGTGFRGRGALSAVTVRIGGERLEALYAGASGDLAGLDQINLSLPRTLAGRGFFATDSWKWAYPYLIDADSWVDYTLLTELSMNGDGYLKSFYFHTQVTDQCRFTPLVMGPPWDFDLAFGNSGAETWNDGLKSPACRIDGHLIYPGSDRMPHLAKLWGDQRFQRKLKERWQALRQNTLSESNIMTLIDDDSRSTVRSREADRNLWKSKFPNLPPRDGSDWPAPCYRGVTTLSGEVQALKDFIRLRLQFMDRYLGSF